MEKQRARIAKGEDVDRSKEADETTFKFLQALRADDTTSLKALTTSDADTPKAGYLIPEPLANEVMRIGQGQYGIARREMRYFNFSGAGDTFRIPTVGTISVSWTDEGGEKPASQPAFGLVTIALKKLTTIVPMTEELLEDSQVNLTALVAELIRDAVEKAEDVAFFAGTGTPYTGLLKDTNIPAVELAATKINGTDVTLDNLYAAIDALPSGALSGAKFYMNRTFISQFRTAKDDNGAYLFNPSAAVDGQIGTFLGYPVVTSDAFPTVTEINSANEAYAIFGNLKVGAAYAEKGDIRLKMLDQATITDTDGSTTINLAQQDMVGLRVVKRVGYKTVLPTAMVRLVAGDVS
jgi:HK97 family phage major capsid protein